uniref:CSON003591 protein n=1 Tax=Culicoides sonorensis TaxID=179676 RepID=A0A336MNU2_CULSO
MNYPRECGCKGARSCLKCESDTDLGIKPKAYYQQFKARKSYVYCYICKKVYEGWDTENIESEHAGSHNNLQGHAFPGILVIPEFLTKDEMNRLMKGIDELHWDVSQSGRRKQNFGPKTNFKKRKLQLGHFKGFPEFSEFVQTKLREEVPLLHDFYVIEQCSLEYDPEKGASIDPHIDDCWVWGERIVTVNLIGDSVLTFNRFTDDSNLNKYNLDCVESYKEHLIPVDGEAQFDLEEEEIIIRVPQPERSLVVMYGNPRYKWEHSVLREDIKERRVCIAYREFTPPYLVDGYEAEQSEQINELAKYFWNHNHLNKIVE